jgi:hypothetical protein
MIKRSIYRNLFALASTFGVASAYAQTPAVDPLSGKENEQKKASLAAKLE